MGEFEDAESRPDVVRGEGFARGQRFGQSGRLVAELDLFGGQRLFVDRARKVRVQEAFLHGLDLGDPFFLGHPLLPLDLADVFEGGLECGAEPLSQFAVRDTDSFQISDDRVFEVFPSPAHGWVVISRLVVGAAIVFVNADSALLQFPLDAFPGDQRSAVLAGEQAAREGMVNLRLCPANLPIQQILAGGERPSVDQRAMLAAIHPVSPADVTDVDAVPQHA